MLTRSLYQFMLCIVLLLSHPIMSLAADFTFSWVPNTEANLAGYKIHYGTVSNSYTTTRDVGLATMVDGRVTATVTGLTQGGTYYFVATAYDSNGAESGYSNEVTCLVESINGAPTAQSSSFTVEEQKSYTGQLTGSDPDGDPLTFKSVNAPQSGTLSLGTNGSFTYTAWTNTGGTDSFSFTVTDSSTNTSAPATVSITVSPAVPLPAVSLPAELHVEAGEVNVGHKEVHITFAQTFSQPVVVANMITRKATDPCVIRISDVSTNGFTVRLQEYDYLDNIHALETISYMVMEKGTHTLSDGTMVEAGTFNTNATIAHAPQKLQQSMNKLPVIMTSIVTVNGPRAVTGRLRNISKTDFEYLLQEQERNAKNHASETVAYIAWEPGSGVHNGMRYAVQATTNSITHKSKTFGFGQTFAAKPFIFGEMQTTNEFDTSILRITRTSTSGVTVFVEEERSRDREVSHTNEQGGFIALMSE
jgi:VCBS repeat-containing protein